MKKIIQSLLFTLLLAISIDAAPKSIFKKIAKFFSGCWTQCFTDLCNCCNDAEFKESWHGFENTYSRINRNCMPYRRTSGRSGCLKQFDPPVSVFLLADDVKPYSMIAPWRASYKYVELYEQLVDKKFLTASNWYDGLSLLGSAVHTFDIDDTTTTQMSLTSDPKSDLTNAGGHGGYTGVVDKIGRLHFGSYRAYCAEEPLINDAPPAYDNLSITARMQACNMFFCYAQSKTLKANGQCVNWAGPYPILLTRLCARITTSEDYGYQYHYLDSEGFPSKDFGKTITPYSYYDDNNDLVTVDRVFLPKVCLYEDPGLIQQISSLGFLLAGNALAYLSTILIGTGIPFPIILANITNQELYKKLYPFDAFDLKINSSAYAVTTPGDTLYAKAFLALLSGKLAGLNMVAEKKFFFNQSPLSLASYYKTLIKNIDSVVPSTDNADVDTSKSPDDAFASLVEKRQWVLKDTLYRRESLGCVDAPMGPYPSKFCQNPVRAGEFYNVEEICPQKLVFDDSSSATNLYKIETLLSTLKRPCVLSTVRNNYIYNSFRVTGDNFIPSCMNDDNTDCVKITLSSQDVSTKSLFQNTYSTLNIIPICNSTSSNAPCFTYFDSKGKAVTTNTSARIAWKYISDDGDEIASNSFYNDVTECSGSAATACIQVYGINYGDYKDLTINFNDSGAAKALALDDADTRITEDTGYYTTFTSISAAILTDVEINVFPTKMSITLKNQTPLDINRAMPPPFFIKACDGNVCTSTYNDPKVRVYMGYYANGDDSSANLTGDQPIYRILGPTNITDNTIIVTNSSGDSETVLAEIIGEPVNVLMGDNNYVVPPFSGGVSSKYGTYRNDDDKTQTITMSNSICKDPESNCNYTYLTGLEYYSGTYARGASKICAGNDWMINKSTCGIEVTTESSSPGIYQNIALSSSYDTGNPSYDYTSCILRKKIGIDTLSCDTTFKTYDLCDSALNLSACTGDTTVASNYILYSCPGVDSKCRVDNSGIYLYYNYLSCYEGDTTNSITGYSDTNNCTKSSSLSNTYYDVYSCHATKTETKTDSTTGLEYSVVSYDTASTTFANCRVDKKSDLCSPSNSPVDREYPVYSASDPTLAANSYFSNNNKYLSGNSNSVCKPFASSSAVFDTTKCSIQDKSIMERKSMCTSVPLPKCSTASDGNANWSETAAGSSTTGTCKSGYIFPGDSNNDGTRKAKANTKERYCFVSEDDAVAFEGLSDNTKCITAPKCPACSSNCGSDAGYATWGSAHSVSDSQTITGTCIDGYAASVYTDNGKQKFNTSLSTTCALSSTSNTTALIKGKCVIKPKCAADTSGSAGNATWASTTASNTSSSAVTGTCKSGYKKASSGNSPKRYCNVTSLTTAQWSATWNNCVPN